MIKVVASKFEKMLFVFVTRITIRFPISLIQTDECCIKTKTHLVGFSISIVSIRHVFEKNKF